MGQLGAGVTGSRALGPPETSLNGWALDSITRVAGAAAGATPGFMAASQPAWSFPGAHTRVLSMLVWGVGFAGWTVSYVHPNHSAGTGDVITVAN